ncbi:MAG: hypothetical protein DGJ47_000489 [Rickettsiaceae bacterium]
MNKKPIIGITLDLTKDSEKYSYAPLPWYAVRADYSNAVEEFGGTAIMIPISDDIDSILDAIDGLIITGCDEDIDPKFYGQTIETNKIKTNDKRAIFEMELARKAMERDMPFLGICNGMQIINVITGGTLIQHIPDTHPSEINHEQPRPKNVPTHGINIVDNTLLDKLSPEKSTSVNSTHHQAVDKVGDGFVVSAIAPDGIIEAIEAPDYKFLVGVEWHSEYLNTDLDRNLFKELIKQSKKYSS